MRLRIGNPACVLVIAPHPDDETIAAHSLMHRLRRRGVAVRVLVVTDGAASHPNSPRWPRRRLVRERERETRAVMRRIGITAGDIAFLRWPDGALSAVMGAAARSVAAAIRRAPKPLVVLAPAPTDDHPDHRAVAAAVASPIRGTRSLAYPVWPAGQRLRGARSLAITAQERLAKRCAIRRYRTQAGWIVDDPSGFAMTRAQIAAFSRSVETFVEMW
ncbi:PIG-L deacetylase family protein [Sphingomonas sp. RS2018]